MPFFNQLKSIKMKRQLSNFRTFNFRTLFIFICITVGFASFTKCDAQAIVGKWTLESSKTFFTPAGVKEVGKPFIITPQASLGNAIFEFKANHTCINTVSINNNPKLILTSTWSVSGDQLTTTLDPHQPDPKYNPKKGDASSNSIIQISGNTLIVTLVMPKSSPTVNKIESTYKKM